MKISELSPAAGSKKRIKRLGRGPGSGHGKTAAKGHKGQASRSGGTKPPWFEGGQQPLTRRVPKRGFKNIFRIEYEIINLKKLSQFEAETIVTPELLKSSGIIKKASSKIKVLSDGSLTKPLSISLHKFSRKAIEKIESSGGRVGILS